MGRKKVEDESGGDEVSDEISSEETAAETVPTQGGLWLRVTEELSELNAKRDRLSAFMQGSVFATLAGTEQERLTRQHQAMSAYAQVLAERLDNRGN